MSAYRCQCPWRLLQPATHLPPTSPLLLPMSHHCSIATQSTFVSLLLMQRAFGKKGSSLAISSTIASSDRLTVDSLPWHFNSHTHSRTSLLPAAASRFPQRKPPREAQSAQPPCPQPHAPLPITSRWSWSR